MKKLSCFLCILVFIVVVVLFFSLVSLFYSPRIECEPYYITGETVCKFPPPFPYRYEGWVDSSSRSGYGVLETSNYKYKGKFLNDQRNGMGELKFVSTVWDPFVSIMKGEWVDNELNDKAEFTLHVNSSLKLVYNGQVMRTKLDGHGDISAYDDGDLSFRLSHGRFSEGMLSVNKKKKKTNQEESIRRSQPFLELFFPHSQNSVKLEIDQCENIFSFSGYSSSNCSLVHKHNTISIVYGWNGKEIQLISDGSKQQQGKGTEPGNADFVIYMTEQPLSKALVLIREFEMNFIFKELDLRKNEVDMLGDVLNLESYEILKQKETLNSNRRRGENENGFISL